MGFDSPNYSPIPPVRDMAPQQPRVSRPTSIPITDGGLGLNMSDPTHNRDKAKIVDSLLKPVILHKKSSNRGKVKSSQGIQPRNQPQQSTSSQATGTTWRPVVHCSACRGDHLHKDCCHETFCIKCRSSSHDTEMCCTPTRSEKERICIYCASKSHSSGRCTDKMIIRRNQD